MTDENKTELEIQIRDLESKLYRLVDERTKLIEKINSINSLMESWKQDLKKLEDQNALAKRAAQVSAPAQ